MILMITKMMIIYLILKITSLYFSIPECECFPQGSTTFQCDANGDCSCKEGYAGSKCNECLPNVIGDKCDTCKPNFFNYPSCQGKEVLKVYLDARVAVARA